MNPSAFRAFTFDCYGTLIDWEQGMLRALRALRALLAIDADDEALLAAFARHEHAIQEENPALIYPEVLGRVCKAIAADFSHVATDEKAHAFGASIADWPPFPDTVEALAYLKQHGLLMVLSNVDRASFCPQRPAPGRSLPRRRHRRRCRELQTGAGAFRTRHGAARGRGHRAQPGAPRGPEPLPRCGAGPRGRLCHLLDRPPRRPPRRGHAAGRHRAGRHLPRPRRAHRLAPRWHRLSAGSPIRGRRTGTISRRSSSRRRS